MFFGSHFLRIKAEHSTFFATVLTPSDAPVDEYHLTFWQWAQKQLRIQSSLSFNGRAGCKALDHLHLSCVCLRLYKPPSDITKHSMQLPSTYEPLHCAAPVPLYACLSLCVDIVFWFSSCIFILHMYIHVWIYFYIYLFAYVFYICLYLYIIFSISLARFQRTCSVPILFTAVPVSLHTAAVSLHCCKKGSGDMRVLSTSLHVSKFSSPISTFMWPLAFVHPPVASSKTHVFNFFGFEPLISRQMAELRWRISSEERVQISLKWPPSDCPCHRDSLWLQRSALTSTRMTASIPRSLNSRRVPHNH